MTFAAPSPEPVGRVGTFSDVRDLLDDLGRWWADGAVPVVARVVSTDGSGPRDPGAAMAASFAPDGTPTVVGSVSGGCVEGAVVLEAAEVADGGRPRLVSFGYSDDEAIVVGLTCGGTVHVFLAPWPDDEVSRAWAAAAAAHRPVALATIVEGPGVGLRLLVGTAGRDGEPEGGVLGSLGDPDLDRVVARDAAGELAAGATTVRHYGPRGQAGEDTVSVFVESFAPPPRLLIFGAVDFTRALCRVGKLLGFQVTVCDAREVFATRRRFPEADEVVVDWPHRHLAAVGDLGPRDAVCVMTHDTKFDVPAIMTALATDVGYLGALGSRRTTERRREHLVEAGATDEQLARLHAPIGLDLGGRSPEEAAISIAAEIIAERNGRVARSLSSTDGPLHT